MFLGRSEKQDGRSGLWLADTFSTSPLKTLNGIQRNLTGSKIATSFIKFVFFGLIRKPRCLPWPLIGWDIFDFYSESTEWKSTKLTESKIATSSTKFVFLRLIGKTKWNVCPCLWLAETFSTYTVKRVTWIQRNLKGSKILKCSGAHYMALWTSCLSKSLINIWMPDDFPVSYSNMETSQNAWNRHSRSYMVDTGTLFSNMKSPSHEYSMAFWPWISYSDCPTDKTFHLY